MASEMTENDAEIARTLSEGFDLYCDDIDWYDSSKIQSPSPVLSKPLRRNSVQQAPSAPSSSDAKERKTVQLDEDAEMALILQIEEIVLSENRITTKTTRASDEQLVETHAAMTKALQPTGQTEIMTRIIGMLVTIQTRYTTCQQKNEGLRQQIQNLAFQLYPALVTLNAPGRTGAAKFGLPTLAIGLVTNLLQGNIGLDDAKGMMGSLMKLWQESGVWYEFLEQLVYMLVAVTVPAFALGAMDKILAKVSLQKQ